jgi:hypothetical protein
MVDDELEQQSRSLGANRVRAQITAVQKFDVARHGASAQRWIMSEIGLMTERRLAWP